MGILHKCLTCDQPITWRFAICSNCEKAYGSKPEYWPKWLRFLWNDIQRERRRHKRVRLHETQTLDDAYDVRRDGKVAQHRPAF